MKVDVLAIGAHPDDADLGVGGLLHQLSQSGFKTGILDLTRGEAASRGSASEREKEAGRAAKILQVQVRENALLPDGGLENNAAQRDRIIPMIRRCKPKVLLTPMTPDRHPDHMVAHTLVRDSNFYAGLGSIHTPQKPYRAPILYFYHSYFEPDEPPTFVVDISDHFKIKQHALRAYASQFYNPEYDGPETLVSSKRFWNSIETRAAYWGARIGVDYGEPIHTQTTLGLNMLPGLAPLE